LAQLVDYYIAIWANIFGNGVYKELMLYVSYLVNLYGVLG